MQTIFQLYLNNFKRSTKTLILTWKYFDWKIIQFDSWEMMQSASSTNQITMSGANQNEVGQLSQEAQDHTHLNFEYSPMTEIANQPKSWTELPIDVFNLKKCKPTFPRSNNGHWTQEEHDTYVEYLMRHKNITLQKQFLKKNNKIFQQMAETIQTRSPSQCRSHHQKFNPFSPQGQKRCQSGRKRMLNVDKLQATTRQLNYESLQTNEDIQNQLFLQQTLKSEEGVLFTPRIISLIFNTIPQPICQRQLTDNFIENLFKPIAQCCSQKTIPQ